MESLIEIILSVIPQFQHLADQAEILISAIPQFLVGLIDTAEILISAIPQFLVGLIDTAEILISAIPQFLVGLPIWLYGAIGMVSLYISWEFLEGKI